MKTNKELLKAKSKNLQQVNSVIFVLAILATFAMVFIGGIINGQPVYFLGGIACTAAAYAGSLLVSVIAHIGIEIASKDE